MTLNSVDDCLEDTCIHTVRGRGAHHDAPPPPTYEPDNVDDLSYFTWSPHTVSGRAHGPPRLSDSGSHIWSRFATYSPPPLVMMLCNNQLNIRHIGSHLLLQPQLQQWSLYCGLTASGPPDQKWAWQKICSDIVLYTSLCSSDQEKCPD